MKVIVASAGTGKTTRLTQRYLEHLEAHPPQRVAAVTFTNKAAAELRERIFEALGRGSFYGFSPSPELAGRLEDYRLRVLEAPIGTIHAFFGHLLRLTAPMLGLDPHFEVADPATARAWFLEEVRNLALLEGAPLEEMPTEALLELFNHRSIAEAFEGAGEGSRELVRLFERVYARWLARLGGRVLDPSELERKALTLIRHPAAMERVRSRIAVVLVDEYQDTAPIQARVFEALEGAGVPIEVVGDPKQSIYGFRDADVEGFREAFRKARASDGVETLEVSYRHPPGLAEFLNAYTAAEAALGEAFVAEEAPPVRSGREGDARIELVKVVPGQGWAAIDDLREGEGRFLARELRRLHDEEGYAYRDMLVLYRRRQQLPPLLRALRGAGLPFAVVGLRGLYEEPEVRELYHALRLATGELPRESLAVFLSGPFGGLTLGQVREVLAQEDPEAFLTLHHPEVAARLRALREDAQTMRPAEALARLVDGPTASVPSFLDLLDLEMVDTVLYVLGRLEQARSYPEAVATLESFRSGGEEEASLARLGGDTVRVMTAHAAKGLEAPVVVIVDADRTFNDRAKPVLVEPRTGRVALEGDEAHGQVGERLRSRQAAEDQRLLYVALSRASERLIVSAGVKEEPQPGSWLHRLTKVLGLEGRFKTRVESLANLALDAEVESTGEEPPVDPGLARPAPPAPPPVSSPSALKAERELEVKDPDEARPVDPEARLLGRVVGILVHEGIQRGWDPDDPEVMLALEGEQVLEEVPADRRPAVLEEVAALLRNYRGLLGSELPPLEERAIDLAELPVVHLLGGTAWEGVIDRLYKVGDTWILEDYKTDREVHPERYHAQLALYREAVRAHWGIEPTARLVYLRNRTVVTLDEAALRGGLQSYQGG